MQGVLPGKRISIAISIALLTFVLTLSVLTTQQAALLGVIALLITLWTNEGLPLAVVSLLPIILFPALNILDTQATTANYAHPIIFLFFGGFLIAIAVEKSGLHIWIAHKILAIFPNTGRGIVLSLVITSGVLSSVLSNTTTTLLLIPIALYLSEDPKLKIRFALAIAYGASVGGIMTPIGTPPNLILMGIMQDEGLPSIPFFQWIWMVAPLSFVMFFIVGFVLSIGIKNVQIYQPLQGQALQPKQKHILWLLISLIILLLSNAPIHPYWDGLGLSEPGILLSAGLLLFMPPFQQLDWIQDKGKIPFRIMFLFGAGFAIAKAFSATGLATDVAISLTTLGTLPFILLLFLIAFFVTFTTEITSNTALISIILPILYAMSVQLQIDATLVMMVATICASYAFMLPIATPPNAIAVASGVIDIKTMASYGFLFNIIGIVLVVTFALLFWKPVLQN